MVLDSSMGHLRKLALLAVIVVQWTLLFRQTYDEKPTEVKRSKVFYDEKEARRFYDHRPKGLFECVNSLTAMPGMCEVRDVEIAGKGGLANEDQILRNGSRTVAR